MYIYQDGKLYVENGRGKLIGVEIHPDKIIKVKGTETKLSDDYEVLTPFEVQAKFNIVNGEEYIFPVDKKEEVVEDAPTVNIKSTTRKSSRK